MLVAMAVTIISMRVCVQFQGELLWRTEDIVEVIREHGDCIALVFFSGMQDTTTASWVPCNSPFRIIEALVDSRP